MFFKFQTTTFTYINRLHHVLSWANTFYVIQHEVVIQLTQFSDIVYVVFL